MIDYFALALSHALLVLGIWLILQRNDLDREDLSEADQPEADEPPPARPAHQLRVGPRA